MAQLVKRCDRHEADDGDDVIDVWTTPNPDGDYVEFTRGGPGDALRAEVLDWQNGRWWRVLDAEGRLLLESSNERECRNVARRTTGATLHRVAEVTLVEWRRVVPK